VGQGGGTQGVSQACGGVHQEGVMHMGECRKQRICVSQSWMVSMASRMLMIDQHVPRDHQQRTEASSSPGRLLDELAEGNQKAACFLPDHSGGSCCSSGTAAGAASGAGASGSSSTLLLQLKRRGLFLHLDTNAGRSGSLRFQQALWCCLQLMLLKTACEMHNGIYHQRTRCGSLACS
jgi:hypothetical protein